MNKGLTIKSNKFFKTSFRNLKISGAHSDWIKIQIQFNMNQKEAKFSSAACHEKYSAAAT
jgi:hypothetical protein